MSVEACGIRPELWVYLWKTSECLGTIGGFRADTWGFPESLLTSRSTAAKMRLSKREQQFRGSDPVRKAKANRAGEIPGAAV